MNFVGLFMNPLPTGNALLRVKKTVGSLVSSVKKTGRFIRAKKI
jgi:hypothetical protein